MSWTLDDGLAEASSEALLILAESGRDPDLAPFVGAVHLGECFLIRTVAKPGEAARAWLGYLTPMERGEANATGLELLDPEQLGVSRLRKQAVSPGELWRSVLEDAFDAVNLSPTVVSLAGRFAVGGAHAALRALERSGWRFGDGHALLRRHRKRKTAAELRSIKRAAAGACEALRRVAWLLRDAVPGDRGLSWNGWPLTAGVLRAEIAKVLAASGLEQPRQNIVSAGADAAMPHTAGSNDRVLAAGESIVVDLFPKGELFADCTRTFCVGEVPEALRSAHGEVVRTLEEVQGMVAAGITGWSLQRAACELFASAGRPTPVTHPATTRGYVHGLGHGVGYEIHEYPSFSAQAGDCGVLETGDVFTLEPGLYDREAGYGVRLEDLCVLGDEGVENLTPLPHALDPASWS